MHPEAEDYEYYMKGTGMKYKVFVYGTLMKGYWNHKCMGDTARYLYNGSTTDQFVMYGRGFPLARQAITGGEPNSGRVVGEVWEVDKQALDRMDRLEGHPTFYERRKTPIFPYPNSEIWMYHWVSGSSVRGEKHRPHDGFLYWPTSRKEHML